MKLTSCLVFISVFLIVLNAQNLSQNSESNINIDQNEADNSTSNIVEDAAVTTLIGSGITAATSAVSSAVISLAGFTSSGVGAGSIAAGIQSGIGLVQAGSSFSYLQAAGALGQGIFGAYALPVVIGVGVIAGSYVLVSNLIEN